MELVYVRVSGQQKEDVFTKTLIDKEIRSKIQKFGKFFKIDFVTIDINRHDETGKKIRYSIKGKIATNKGLFFADVEGWNLVKIIHELFTKFEKEIIKKKEKMKF